MEKRKESYTYFRVRMIVTEYHISDAMTVQYTSYEVQNQYSTVPASQ